MSAAEPDSLPMPTLDAESAALLQSISAHGGYAYARLASSDDPRAAEAAREMAWEQLHSAPWHSVLPVWRDAYSMSCLHVAKSHYRNREFKEALRVLDMGILMGGSLLRADLDSAVRIVSAKARENEETGLNGEEGRRLKKLVEETDFNKAEVVRLLPVRSLACKIVVKRSGLSLEGFLKEHFVPACPVVISDSMGHWPALSKWNDVDYLDKVAGNRTVPVKVGKNYLCQVWKQELITFSQFLERVRLHDSSSSVPTYLAQHQLFDQISELRKDVCIPDYCFVGGGELRSLNAWFGPCGTVTPLHHDPYHNILAQVVGKKYIRLYSASHSEELYPHSETMLCNSSKVDLDNIDETEFPKMLDLDFQDCILEEGEMLYIPPKWWHYVRSLTRSVSVSFWWSDSNPANS